MRKQKNKGNPIIRLGVALIIYGYGSALLSAFGLHFTLLAWAGGMQPWFGLILGTAGLALLLAPGLIARSRSAAPDRQQPFAAQPPYAPQPPYGAGLPYGKPTSGGVHAPGGQQQYPAGPPQAGYGQPQAPGYAAQQYPQPQFPPQQYALPQYQHEYLNQFYPAPAYPQQPIGTPQPGPGASQAD